MILRAVQNMDLPLFLLLLSWSTAVMASDEPFDCRFQVGALSYDLSPLESEQVITRDRPTPPTREVDSVRLSLCSDLKHEDDVSEEDQCPPGTRVCLTKINYKDDAKRIVSVIPIAQTSATLNPVYKTLSSPKGVSVLLHGSPYPHPINVTDAQQSVNITFLCDTSDPPTSPKFTSYDGAQLNLEWSTPQGCGFAADGGNHENEDSGNEKSGSGSLSSVGWFLLLLLVAFAAYMGLGAYFNYTTYGASGVDLIPHRDFWMEVPYMLRDVLSHLCSTVRPRRSANRGGYIAV
ncbi:autophagy-related protein 27 [Mycena rosella]|uniref:Autophagy-related protein 27 n=1 Tax=Mycena rosella TaxID=1033263 RepID=A0AAD7DZ83_MYCRO|nr:autophagy-related protein 27 [Mycena rosella]